MSRLEKQSDTVVVFQTMLSVFALAICMYSFMRWQAHRSAITPVEAVERGDLSTLAMMVRNDPTVVRSRQLLLNRTLLHYAAERNQVEIVKFLLSQGASFDTVDSDGQTAVHSAASAGSLEVLDHLVAVGADFKVRESPDNGSNWKGLTPLDLAAGSGHFAVVKYLVDLGAPVDDPSIPGRWTALHWACGRHLVQDEHSGNQVSSIIDLLSRHIDINRICSNHSPLTCAIDSKSLFLIRHLLANYPEIEVNRPVIDGNSPLHQVIISCNDGEVPEASLVEIVELLLLRGAKRDVRNDSGLLPIDIARNFGMPQVVHALSK